MAYNIAYKKSVIRDLKKLPKTEARRILNKIEKGLLKDPYASPALKGPFAGLRKFRIGDYRVVYVLFLKNILILRIGHRRDVYKDK